MPVTAAPMQGHGYSITFSSGYFKWLLDAEPIQAKRNALETTHSSTTDARSFIAEKLVDYGGIRVTFQLDPDETVDIDAAPESVTFTYPLASGAATAAKLVGSAFMTDYSENVPINGIMTCTCTLKWAGKPTRTAAS